MLVPLPLVWVMQWNQERVEPAGSLSCHFPANAINIARLCIAFSGFLPSVRVIYSIDEALPPLKKWTFMDICSHVNRKPPLASLTGAE